MYHFSADVPLNSTYDVIVIGGGVAGCAAATASAREGAKTLLVEQTISLGGLGTNGLVPNWCGYNNGGPPCSAGIGRTVIEAVKERMTTVPHRYDFGPVDAEILKTVLDDLCTGAGVDILFGTALSAVQTDGEGRVTEILLTNKAGLTAYRAKVFVDTTGDADLTAWAGGEFELGNEEGDTQAATMCFTLTNVDITDFASIRHHRLLWPNGGKYPLIQDPHCVATRVGAGTVGFNAGHIYNVDPTDPVSLSKGILTGRRLVSQIVSALRELCPTVYGKAHLDKTQSLLGIREGRRIRGDYTLRREDYFARRVFPDEIARNCYSLDRHRSKKEWDRETVHAEDVETVFAPGESHGIPYRSLVPVGLKNVIVAGRCISADRDMQGTTRIMGACFSTGEAAGVAAAQASSQPEPDMHRVDTDLVREKLRRAGAYIL